jgi:hypothetical protein
MELDRCPFDRLRLLALRPIREARLTANGSALNAVC